MVQYRYLAVLEGPDPETAAPLFHTEDAEFISLVLRLAARHLKRSARRPARGLWGVQPALRVEPGDDAEGSE